MWRGLACLALVAPLGGCGAVGGASMETFDLSASYSTVAATKPKGQLLIDQPVASSPIDSDRVVVRPTPDTVATLKGAQWSEPLPRLLQTRMLQSFESGRALIAVGRPGSGIEARYMLASEIRHFELDIENGEAVVEISVKFVATDSGKVVATRVFSARAPGSAKEPGAAAAALNTASSKVIDDIVAWTTSRV